MVPLPLAKDGRHFATELVALLYVLMQLVKAVKCVRSFRLQLKKNTKLANELTTFPNKT